MGYFCLELDCFLFKIGGKLAIDGNLPYFYLTNVLIQFFIVHGC